MKSDRRKSSVAGLAAATILVAALLLLIPALARAATITVNSLNDPSTSMTSLWGIARIPGTPRNSATAVIICCETVIEAAPLSAAHPRTLRGVIKRRRPTTAAGVLIG